MARIRYRNDSIPEQALLFFTAGAIAGLSTGIYFARKYKNGQQLLHAVRRGAATIIDLLGAPESEEELSGVDKPQNGERDVEPEFDDEGAFADMTGEETVAVAEERLARQAARANARRQEHALEARVLDAFEQDGVLRSRAVDITAVGESIIELTGWVRSVDEAARAASVARQVEGVSMVLNRVAIRGTDDTIGSIDSAAGREPPADRPNLEGTV